MIQSGDDHGRAPRLVFDLSGIRVGLNGLSAGIGDRLQREWALYSVEPDTDPFLVFDINEIERHYSERDFKPKEMESALSARRAEFRMPEGAAIVESHGPARISLVRDIGDRQYYALHNFVRACLAWRLPGRGAGLFHSAGVVLGGRSFLLVGAQDSGKSSWSRLAVEAGCALLSDDLNMIDPADDGRAGFETLGTPFRSTEKANLVKGRWPLAAILFPVHGREPGLTSTPPLIAQARLAANLPFITEGLEQDERIPTLVAALAGRIPCAELTFALDTGFVALLRSWPEGAGS